MDECEAVALIEPGGIETFKVSPYLEQERGFN